MSHEADTTQKASSRFTERIKDRLIEGAVYNGALAATVAIGFFTVQASQEQDSGIASSLKTEGSQHIPGFEVATVDGTMYNYSEGSIHGATVELDTGDTCSIQFTTISGESLWSQLIPGQANIVSYGTCPTDIPTGVLGTK